MGLSSADLKRSLSTELASVVKAALKEDTGEKVSNDVLNNICNVTEAIFIHGLKSIHFLTSKNVKYPEPNLWQLLVKFSPRGLRSSIAALSQIKTEVGRSRAWIRQALNDGVLENYVAAFDRPTLRQFYHKHAYLLDPEQSEVFRNYVKAMSRLHIEAPTNSALLNQWTPTPLRLAGLLHKPRPVLSGMTEMDAVLEEVGEAATVTTAEDALDLLDPPSRDEYEDDVTRRPVSVAGSSRFAYPHSEAGESCISVLSHPSIVDDKFAAIMKEMSSRISSSSGPTREEEPLFDSGISPDTNSPNQVVVHRGGQQNSTRRKVRGGESIAGRFPSITPPPLKATTAPMPILPNADMTPAEEEEERPKSLAEELHEVAERMASAQSSLFSPPKSAVSEMEESFQTAIESSVDCPEDNKEAGTSEDSQFLSPLPPAEEEAPGSRVAASLEASFNSIPSENASPGNSIGRGSSWWSGGGDDSESMGRTSRGSTFCEVISTRHAGSFNQLLTQTLQRYEASPEAKEAEGLDLSGPGESSTPTPVDGPSLSPHDFEILEEAEGENAVSREKDEGDWRLNLITRIPSEAGLDSQDYRCKTCRKNIGLMYGPYRVCEFDGGAYCLDCHRDETARLPAHIILNWDLQPKKVSRASRAFLEHVGDKPLIQLNQANSSLYDAVPEMGGVLEQRRELSFVAAYLRTCKESVAAELDKRLWPKEYLRSELHLYSLNDLVWVSSGGLRKHLSWVLDWAEAHVASCPLCSQKGFICECGQPPVVFPFQLATTVRCDVCCSVAHKECGKGRPCRVCARRDAAARSRAESALIEPELVCPPLREGE